MEFENWQFIEHPKSSIYHQITKRQEKENQDEAISLISIWMNRILFLKLFETQLFEFNGKKKEFNFFSSSKVRDCSDLSNLFFHVLNTPIDDRILQDKHDLIPYLNSSLFEKKSLENILTIAEVLNERKEIYPKTSLKSKKGQNLTFVQYLLEFLDAYSFNEADEETDKETGEIISSSVLGLVFEKLNGYKDGSFFTPASITELLTKEVIDRVVLDKFNALFAGVKAPAENIEELRTLLGYDAHKTDRKELYIKTFNDIKILDPACGSGHFLVSALNYLIYLKSYLGLMPFSNRIEIHNDSLVVLDTDGTKAFSYQRNDETSARIQQQLFEEKANVIRNSLFGCDINPMPVEICRLRLWIELLKNAYYKSDFDMEVLPNIDINIKAGDALSSSHWRRGNANLYATPKQLKDLKTLLEDYKAGRYKTSKHALLKEIRQNQVELKEQLAFTDKLDNPIRWEIDFPEALNPRGGFEGFDVVIGNPPYIQLQKNEGFLRNKYEKLGYLTFASSGDIYQLFYEQGWHLLKNNGYLCFITSNKWMRSDYGKQTRQLLSENLKLSDEKNTPIDIDLQLLLDLGKNKIFDNAQVDTNILIFKKSKKTGTTTKCKFITDSKDLVSPVSSCLEMSFPPDQPWAILSSIEQTIRNKLFSTGTPLKNWNIQINYGIKTGCNEAFVITTEKRQEILNNCKDPVEKARTEALIQPILRGSDIKKNGYNWDKLWLVATFPARNYDINLFPAVRSHLLTFAASKLEEKKLDWVADNFLEEFCEQKLSQTNQFIQINGRRVVIDNKEEKSRKKTSNKWFETQDNISYWNEFSKQKVVYSEISTVMKATFVPPNWFINNKLYMITGNNGDLKIINAFLNSNIFTKIVLPFANFGGGKGPDFMKEVYFPNNIDPSSFNNQEEFENELHKSLGLTQKEIDFIKA